MTRAGTFGAVVFFAVIGCGGEAPRTITADDITPIPPGTAIGSVFSGDYVLTRGMILGCHCRFGSCATLHVNVGALLTAVQTDGTLQITSPNGVAACSGGIDDDGMFRCDGSLVEAGHVEFSIASGQFHAANGQPTSLNMTEETTSAGSDHDCDIKGSLFAQYTGPPTALVATLPPTTGLFGISRDR